MTIADPWSVVSSKSAPISAISLQFEDNFAPLSSEALPDSAQYLAILEAKLRKIKADPDVLKQLSEKREACMQHFLAGETQYDADADLDAPSLANSHLIRSLRPQKQALNRGELAELVRHDHLAEKSG